MENRYLFKAKRVDNGEWVEGNILLDIEKNKPSETYRIYPIDHVDICKVVDETTICQCTGLRDKNGKLIWENDILNLDEGINAGCFWDEVNLEWGLRTPTRTIPLCSYSLAELAVTGNIFDNPELLKSEG